MLYGMIMAGVLLCVAAAEWFSEREDRRAVVACGIALLLLVCAAFAAFYAQEGDAAMLERPESVWTELQERTEGTMD